MSDFFMPTQKNNYSVQNENENENRKRKSIFTSDSMLTTDEEFQQQKQQRLANRQRYGVTVPDQIYEVFNQMCARCSTPEEANELSYKLGSACRYMEMAGDTWDNFQNYFDDVDNLNAAQFPNLQDQKSRFEALSDSLQIGKNNVKLGELGQKLMKAHKENDIELADSLMAEINAINQQNVLLQDNVPRHFLMQELEAGAQSLPFSGAAAVAGVFGNFIAPGAGTAASFAVSSYLAAGSEYVDMIANGSTPETARTMALITGGIEGIIEANLGITKGIVKGSARLMGKEVAESFAQKKLKEIESKVLKNVHFGTFKRNVINYLERRGGDILGEGMEEFWQENASILGKEIAAALDGYDIPDDDIKSIVKQTTQAFKGGVLGALGLGLLPGMNPARLEAYADFANTKFVRDAAEAIDSEEVFKNTVKDNPIFKDMPKEQKDNDLHEIWQNAQQRKEERTDLEARKIAEGLDAGEGAEGRKVTVDENGNEIEQQADPVARNDAGRLITKDEVTTDENGNVTGGTFRVGDTSKSEEEGNRYGYIKYSTAENGDITIEDFKMNSQRQGLRAEVFEEFAREHPDVNIEWNAIGSEWQDVKQDLIKNNPSGAKNGLRYFTTADIDDIATRKSLFSEIRENVHNYKPVKYFDENNQAKIRYEQSELTNEQLATAVEVIELRAKHVGLSVTDYMNKRFKDGKLFGNPVDITKSALVQKQNPDTINGGIKPGKARENWQKDGMYIKGVIYAAQNADFATLIHELSHGFRAELTGQELADAEAAFDVKDGDWDALSKYKGPDGEYLTKEEAFAYFGQDYFITGKAPTPQMENVFKRLAKYLAEALSRLSKHLEFSPEIAKVFNNLLANDDSVYNKALKAAQEEEGEYRAKLKRDAEEKLAQKAAEAEQAKKQAEAEREEAAEGTDFSEEEVNAPTAEELLKGIEEAENGTEKTQSKTNAIDNALKDLPLTDEQKAEIAETLKDETSTVVEKAEAATEAAASVYAKDVDEEDLENANKLYESETVEINNSISKESGDELREDAIIEYNKLKEAHTVDGKKVEFTGRGRKKIVYHSADPTVLRCTPQLKDLLEKAVFLFSELPNHYTEKDSIMFYNYGIKINLDGEEQLLRLSVRETPAHEFFYDAHNTRIEDIKKGLSPSSIDRQAKPAEADESLTKDKLYQWLKNVKKNFPEDMLFQIAGEIGAENLDNADVQDGVNRMQNLAIAKQMETDGKDAKAIRLATGWEKGSDGKWRYELDDSKIKVENDFYPDKYFLNKYPRLRELEEKIRKDITAYNNFTDEERNDYDYYSSLLSKFVRNHIDFVDGKQIWKEPVELNDVMEAPELFKAYPQLEKIKFIVKNLEAGLQGQYDADTDIITLSPMAGKSTLLHEVQHAIQDIEGFAKGGNERQFDEISAEPLREKVSELNKKMSEVLTEYVPLEDWLAIDQKLLEQNLSPEEYAQERIDAISKYDNGEYRKLAEEQQKIISRIEEIEENALEGQVEIDGRTYEDAFEAYRSLAGEVEARNVQTRMNFTPEERHEALLAATEDVDRDDQIMLFQTVYHGSGADFDKFDTENFGLSGEGSMSFGYGAYVTDSKDIALNYAERQGNPIQYRIKALTEIIKEEEEILKENISERLRYVKEKDLAKYKEELEKLKEQEPTEEEIRGKRALYTVEIPNDGFIKWDENINPQIVEGIIKEHGYFYGLKNLLDNYNKWKDNPNATYLYGSNVYKAISRELGSDKAASHFLQNLGFKGIDYPAGTVYGNGDGSRNYVVFNDADAQIVDKLLFQTQAELMDEARTFETWQEFMEYCELFHSDDEVSPIPSDSDAQWYQSFWEQAKGVQTEQEKNKQEFETRAEKNTTTANAVDALFSTYLKTYPQMIDEFLKAVADIDAINLDSEEWQQAESAEDAAQRDKIDQLKDFINITLSDYNWQTALKRVQGGHEIAEGLRKRLIGEMTDGFKVRDFRALYAEVMNEEQYAVSEEDSITATLNKKLRKYHDIVKPGDDISRWSPERRKQLAEQLQNREIAAKIKNGSLKLDDELDAYIKSLTNQIKEKQKQFDELEAETKADYQRIADKERRDLLKLHEQLLLTRGKLNTKNTEINRKIAKGLKITEKYSRAVQNLNANYDEIFRKYEDLRNSITINSEVQAALDRQEQVAGLREDLNAKQKEKNLTAEVKKMRIQLVKKTMRRVPFNRIDYNNARTVIAIQRMLEPNLLGGVNRFIGIDSPYLRGVISQIVTDSDYKEKILNYLSKNSKASQAFADFKKKLTELKSIKDFDSWTAKERKAAIKYLPKENWVRDLNLKELAKEREESIDLDIDMEEVKRTVYDEKTGELKTYKDKEGITHNVTETAFKLKADEEIERLVQDAVGADMFDKIVNMPFSEWTTEDLETLAQRIDELYTEGRDLKAAKDEARKKEAAVIRKRIEDAIKDTGITINDDDTPEEKERKQKQIEKILGMSNDLKGTEAGKTKGFKAKITRLLHSYFDMNVLRFARMLDGQSEGENYRMLYRKEDDCYNAKQRSMNSRAEKIYKVMKDNNITEGDLAKTVKVTSLGTEFTVDELLYFLAADKDYVEDEKKVQRGLIGLDANDDYAATSRNAVMFGNMMSDMMSQEEKESWLQLDKDMQEALQNDTLTQEQKEQQAAGFLDKTPGTTRYIAACHAKWGAVLGAVNNYLNEHPQYKALMEAIEEDYASQYERMNEVSINEFNMPVHRVKAYVPLVRRESNGDTNEAQVKEDLLGAAGVGKQWADRGMTQRRVQISPLNQKPVQTGLFTTWGSSIERTEHFIAYAPYVRQLNAIYKSRDASYTRRFIESRYGNGAIKYLDEYINEVANPNAGRIRERGAELLHVLRGKTAPAYLGWKASGIIKQGLTSPWPYMQFVNPAEYMAAAMKFTFNPEMREAIKEKSVFMKMRRMDPVNDLIDEMADNAKTKIDRGWSNFTKLGMQGLELIDWACVAPGWLACYEKKYNQLQNASNARYESKMAELKERNMYAEVGTSEYLTPQQMEAEAKKEILEDIETEAVRYADDCTRACQPSNRVTDLAPLFKNSSEAMKAFLQFQTSLNVIWQNLRYDMPYAVKNKEFTRIAGTIIGYVCAGIFMNSVMEGIGGDDDDDDTQALRNLIYYSTTQFTDAVPILGSEITNVMDKVITGKRAYAQSGTDMTPSATKLLTALQNTTSGNWKKAAELTAEGIGLYLGAPVSGTKEIYKLLGKPLSEGDVNFKRGISDVYGLAGDILEE